MIVGNVVAATDLLQSNSMLSRRAFTLTFAGITVSAATTAAVRGDKAAYVGGTVATIKEGTAGVLNLEDTADLRFSFGTESEYRVPYSRITTMEFGQKVGRRVGATIAVGVTTLGIGALPMLFSKKKKHYLTIAFTNAAGGNEVMVLELSKGLVRTTLPILEARTGKKVELEQATAKEGKERS
jgi:hypothetical protein